MYSTLRLSAILCLSAILFSSCTSTSPSFEPVFLPTKPAFIRASRPNRTGNLLQDFLCLFKYLEILEKSLDFSSKPP